MKTTTWALGFAIAMAATGCVAADTADSDSTEQDVAGTVYVPLQDFNSSQFQDQWFDIGTKLAGQFDDVCGDTFCGGDYSNLTPLTFMCSVSSKAGSVHDCAWTFGGSLASVSPTTAAISVDAPTFECHVSPKTTAAKLVTFLQTETDLHATLPGTTGSIYDELVSCFQHPINHTPVTFPTVPKVTYVDADVYYSTDASVAKWDAAKAALKLGFDNVCGDTFCGGDYGDLQSLSVICSVTKSSGNVKSCDWIFAGSITEFDAHGIASPASKSWTCPITVKGTLPQLITTLTATGTTDPINRALPGMTTSAYDAIAACLP